jgi:hypothetical protein
MAFIILVIIISICVAVICVNILRWKQTLEVRADFSISMSDYELQHDINKCIEMTHVRNYNIASNTVTANMAKSVNNIMFLFPTIDRDAHLVDIIYNAFESSIDYALTIDNISYDVFVTCRKSDLIVQREWKKYNNIKFMLVDDYIITNNHNYDGMLNTYNNGRLRAINDNYDAMMIIESDVGIKKQTIHDMIDIINTTKYDVVSAIVTQSWCDIPFITVIRDRAVQMIDIDKYINKYNITTNYVDVSFCDTGSTMLSKNALHIPFTYDKIFGIHGIDVGWGMSLFANGINMCVLSNYISDHYYKDRIKQQNSDCNVQ